MLVLREITEEAVGEAINNPDEVLPSRDNTKIYLKNFGKNYLKLVISEDKSDQIVITLHWLARSRVRV